jgi:hypothetical protein
VPCATYLSISFLKAVRHILQTILCVVQSTSAPSKHRTLIAAIFAPVLGSLFRDRPPDAVNLALTRVDIHRDLHSEAELRRLWRIPAHWLVSLDLANIENRLRKGLRRFLGKVVSDSTVDGSVRVLAGELVRVGARLRVRCSVGIAFKRYRGHRDGRKRRKTRLELVIACLTLGKPEAPTVVVDRDVNVCRGARGTDLWWLTSR